MLCPHMAPRGLHCPAYAQTCFRLECTTKSYMNSSMHLTRLGLAKATKKVYDSASSHFTSFCWPSLYLSCLRFPMICAIIVHCFETHKMQTSSRKALVAGIQMPLRYVDPSVCTLLGNPSIGLLFGGLKKEQPKKYFPSHYL